jgi:hypothetical protein
MCNVGIWYAMVEIMVIIAYTDLQPDARVVILIQNMSKIPSPLSLAFPIPACSRIPTMQRIPPWNVAMKQRSVPLFFQNPMEQGTA